MDARMIRLWADESGESHLGEMTGTLRLVDFAPPAPPMGVGELVPATSVHYLGAPAGWVGDFHQAPRRQYIIGLRGSVEGRASDGTSATLGPGDIVLLEDTHGIGHSTRVIGDEDWLALVVVLG